MAESKKARKLERDQPETLFAIWRFARREFRIPTAAELHKALRLRGAVPAAAMRLQRLKADGYLTNRDGSWKIDQSTVIDRPTTAAFLLALQRQESVSLPRGEVVEIAKNAGVRGTDDEIERLLTVLTSVGYLESDVGIPSQLRLGSQFGNDRRYIELLATENAPSAPGSRRRRSI